ncbi:hypothetical protein [Nonomuraea indica]|uniref:hypothetical protein n=1 Tax=Nonomuraea indica TaxID=1581193 RepID=UPI000C7D803B|nr:hypothetical protein [Nonomuraea indica]
MIYGPSPERPRATGSASVIVLVSGLTCAVGFLLGYVIGLGSGESVAAPAAPRITVTMEEPVDPESSGPAVTPSAGGDPAATPPGPGDPAGTAPAATAPAATAPAGTAPAATAPGVTTTGGTNGVTAPAGNRTLVVGVDIHPGTYRTAGPATGQPMCYWARLKSTVPQAADIIAADMPRGAATVTIAPTDKAFQTGGCAEWTKV